MSRTLFLNLRSSRAAQPLLALSVLLLLPGVGVADNVPRAEPPQPQFQRTQWMSLNGRWEFEFDDTNRGADANWQSNGKKFSHTITVPYCFESKLSGIGETGFHPWVWYRRRFAIPPEWKGKNVLLKFGAVDYRASVWVNGNLAGTHEGGNTPFRFDISHLLHDGSNVLMVRAEDPPTDRSIPRGKQYWEPKSKGIFYTRTSGIWQSVWLEAVHPTHLEQVHMTPSLDGTVRFDAGIENGRDGLVFQVQVFSDGKVVASGSTNASESSALATLQIPEPKLWSPNAPNLYDVKFELRHGGAVIDTVQSYFGLRTISIYHGRVLLNRRPIYLKMVLDQGYWPQSVLTPPTDEAIQFDIKMTKEMGFNGVRKHQKLEDPRFLYWADKMGLFVSSEMANAYEFSDQYVRRFNEEWIEAVERDYNHPSVIMWVPINESWGVPNIQDSRQQNHLRAMYALTKSLDQTRPVIDNDGWEHTDATDLFAIHDYAASGEQLYQKYKDLGKTDASIPDVSRPVLAPGYGYNHSPFLLSEFGGIAFVPPSTGVAQEAWGYAGIEKSQKAAVERLRGLYSAIARIPAFAGICLTQLTDVEQEINGLMTYDRKPKYDAAVIRELNEMLH